MCWCNKITELTGHYFLKLEKHQGLTQHGSCHLVLTFTYYAEHSLLSDLMEIIVSVSCQTFKFYRILLGFHGKIYYIMNSLKMTLLNLSVVVAVTFNLLNCLCFSIDLIFQHTIINFYQTEHVPIVTAQV